MAINARPVRAPAACGIHTDARRREETNVSSVDGLDKSPEIIIPHTLALITETMLLSTFPALTCGLALFSAHYLAALFK